MKHITCYEVSSSNEDGSRYTHDVYFANEDHAKAYVKEKYNNVWGHCERKDLVILETLDEVKDFKHQKLMESARRKLTDEEQQALGLK